MDERWRRGRGSTRRGRSWWGAALVALLTLPACGDDGDVTAETFCEDYAVARDGGGGGGDGPDWGFWLEWIRDTGGEPVNAATQAYRFAARECPTVTDDDFLLAWFAELGLDPELPPIAEPDDSDPPS